jgi:chemotaxis protein methyltransferase CheR
MFREIRHFNLLRKLVTQWADDRNWRAQQSTLRIWSAACSSGEEPHSLAMVAYEALQKHPGIELKILATDLSTQMLSRAKLARYEPHRVGTVPPELKAKYLRKVKQDGGDFLQLVPELRRTITFSRFNLMSPTFPFSYGFHVIFCRNVMIYFDRPTQKTLVNKLSGQLRPGGYLMIGHSESLNGIDHPLSYVEPTVYQKT